MLPKYPSKRFNLLKHSLPLISKNTLNLTPPEFRSHAPSRSTAAGKLRGGVTAINKRRLRNLLNHDDVNGMKAFLEDYKEKHKEDYKINQVDELDETILFYLADNLKTKMLRFLIGEGLDLTVTDRNGDTALTCALKISGCKKFVKALLDTDAKKKIDIDAKNKAGDSALIIAARTNQVDVLPILLSKTPNINQTDNCGKTALHLAVEGQHTKLFPVLLGNDFEDVEDGEGYTVLMKAVLTDTICQKKREWEEREGYPQTANPQTVKSLLEIGRLDVNRINKQGYTALHLAAAQGGTNAIQVLLRYKADETIGMTNGDTALIVATRTADAKVVDTLLGCVNQQNRLGETAAHIAALQNDVPSLQLLLANGADMEIKDKQGRSVSLAAKANLDWEMAEVVRAGKGRLRMIVASL